MNKEEHEAMGEIIGAKLAGQVGVASPEILFDGFNPVRRVQGRITLIA